MAFCRDDVLVTRDLFPYGLEKGRLIYREKRSGRRVRLLVDWRLEELIKDSKGSRGQGFKDSSEEIKNYGE
ncbi:MAG: hypothetical protein GY849_24415 [Deltaproteobacteria bacterium]|nr:hypothetical protein [Deltaproteobacteria bacterium]